VRGRTRPANAHALGKAVGIDIEAVAGTKSQLGFLEDELGGKPHGVPARLDLRAYPSLFATTE